MYWCEQRRRAAHEEPVEGLSHVDSSHEKTEEDHLERRIVAGRNLPTTYM